MTRRTSSSRASYPSSCRRNSFVKSPLRTLRDHQQETQLCTLPAWVTEWVTLGKLSSHETITRIIVSWLASSFQMQLYHRHGGVRVSLQQREWWNSSFTTTVRGALSTSLALKRFQFHCDSCHSLWLFILHFISTYGFYKPIFVCGWKGKHHYALVRNLLTCTSHQIDDDFFNEYLNNLVENHTGYMKWEESTLLSIIYFTI